MSGDVFDRRWPDRGASLGGVGGEPGAHGVGGVDDVLPSARAQARWTARLMAASAVALGLMVMPLRCTGRNTRPVLMPLAAGQSPRARTGQCSGRVA